MVAGGWEQRSRIGRVFIARRQRRGLNKDNLTQRWEGPVRFWRDPGSAWTGAMSSAGHKREQRVEKQKVCGGARVILSHTSYRALALSASHVRPAAIIRLLRLACLISLGRSP